MKLTLQREPSENLRTYGKLYIDGVYFCETLEDQIREVTGKPVAEWKIYGQTAIPAGTYPISFEKSPHFCTVLPLLMRVPGFSMVWIHWGNTALQTEGCILVGKTRGDLMIGAKKLNAVLQSQLAFKELFARLQGAEQAKEPISIEILNPINAPTA